MRKPSDASRTQASAFDSGTLSRMAMLAITAVIAPKNQKTLGRSRRGRSRSPGRGRAVSISAPPSNACRLLARDHAAPESTLALAKAASLGRGRVRPLAWCSRPRSSAALLEGALMDADDRLRLDYEQTTQLLRTLTDIRFK